MWARIRSEITISRRRVAVDLALKRRSAIAPRRTRDQEPAADHGADHRGAVRPTSTVAPVVTLPATGGTEAGAAIWAALFVLAGASALVAARRRTST